MSDPTKTTPQVDLVELVRNLRNLSNEQLAKVAEEAKTQAGHAAVALQVAVAGEKAEGFEQGQARASRYLNDSSLRDKFIEPYYDYKLKENYLTDLHTPPPASDFSVALGIAELRQQSAKRQAELLTQARERGVTEGMVAGPKKEGPFKGFDIELSDKFRNLLLLVQIEKHSEPRFDLTDVRRDGGTLKLPDSMKKTM